MNSLAQRGLNSAHVEVKLLQRVLSSLESLDNTFVSWANR